MGFDPAHIQAKRYEKAEREFHDNKKRRDTPNGLHCAICDITICGRVTEYMPYCCVHDPTKRTGCRFNRNVCTGCGARDKVIV